MKIKINKQEQINDALNFINEKINKSLWHQQILEVQNYHAILLTPYGAYLDVMNEVVEIYKSENYDCFFKSAYDARGPHYCFYINKKHFK